MKNLVLLILLITGSNLRAQDKDRTLNTVANNPKTLPVLWQQTSAEYRALCYQAFNLAALRINEIPENILKRAKPAIITDIDETILDNTPEEAQLILNGKWYNDKDWKAWTNIASARAVPGAVEFMQLAHSKGISIFYISNRDTSEILSTVKNLKELNFPDADHSHMLFMSASSSKETRRQLIMNDYYIVLMLGDNLNDFTAAFEKNTIAGRSAEADKLKDDWGNRFIVLPNSIYGEWENALYGYNRKLTFQQKDSIRVHLLKGYK